MMGLYDVLALVGVVGIVAVILVMVSRPEADAPRRKRKRRPKPKLEPAATWHASRAVRVLNTGQTFTLSDDELREIDRAFGSAESAFESIDDVLERIANRQPTHDVELRPEPPDLKVVKDV